MGRRLPDTALRATWTFVIEPLPDGRSRLLDRHNGERGLGAVGRASDTFWTIGTLLMERGMHRGIKARAERTAVGTRHGCGRDVRSQVLTADSSAARRRCVPRRRSRR